MGISDEPAPFCGINQGDILTFGKIREDSHIGTSNRFDVSFLIQVNVEKGNYQVD